MIPHYRVAIKYSTRAHSKDMFEFADADGNGTLGRLEFDNVINAPALRLGLTGPELDELWASGGPDNNGILNLHEFVPMCRETLVRLYARCHIPPPSVHHLPALLRPNTRYVTILYPSRRLQNSQRCSMYCM